ncbi:hypothetical protein LEP1GSC112_1944 [Leptospira interrogans serovar Pomona str. UT364]|nr:hypothetical protein LEP1GSC112_1944 [Leptospira interrogans serovar Pomona str. UT364]
MKTAFASYCYIRPENSTRYLNEFSFLKNAHVFGLDVICENADVLAGNDVRDGVVVGETKRWGELSVGSDPRGPLEPAVGIGRKG